MPVRHIGPERELGLSEIASKGQLWGAYFRWAVVTVPLILLLGFASARLFPGGSENAWYMALAKPSVTPPGWVFGAVWTVLYILMGLALAMILNARGSRWRGPAILLFGLQFIANLAWTPVFFGYHAVIAALILIVVVFVLALLTTLWFGRIRSVAAWLMVPYLAWIVFAGILLYQVHAMNPDAATLVPHAASTQIAL